MQTLTLPTMSGMMVLLSAAMIWAQAAQDWIPEAISLPDDMQVLVDRAIGSSTRIFSFETNAAGEPLIEKWTTALREAGYTIEPSDNELEQSQIEFSGPGIGNAKIAVQPDSDDSKTVFQFDASLTD